MNSSNSSNPPSSEGLKHKTKSVMSYINVANSYRCKLIHDFWGPYDTLEDCTHMGEWRAHE